MHLNIMVALLAGWLGVQMVTGCASETASAPVPMGKSSQQGDQTSASLVGAAGDPAARVRAASDASSAVGEQRIAAQLRSDALDAIEPGDGAHPITQGDWARFPPDLSWTWQLMGRINTRYDVDVYVLDLFQMARSDLIDRLHAQERRVICYFSAGTFEPWRPDVDLFAKVPMGNTHFGYSDETWLDIRSADAVKIMLNRMDMAVAIGCDGVELDNVDAFADANNALGLSIDDLLHYQRVLANEAHKRNLAVVIKNSIETLADVADYVDLAINESCMAWDECGAYQGFIAAGKAVFHVEYDNQYLRSAAAKAELCGKSKSLNMRTLLVPKTLDGAYRISCDD